MLFFFFYSPGAYLKTISIECLVLYIEWKDADVSFLQVTASVVCVRFPKWHMFTLTW